MSGRHNSWTILDTAPLPDNQVLGPSIRDVGRINPLLFSAQLWSPPRSHNSEVPLICLQWECPPRARDVSETADGCQSGNALVGGRQVCEDHNTFPYRPATICKDIAERMLLLRVESTGSPNTCSGPCPSTVLDIATPTPRWISSWLSLWDLPLFKVSGISQHGEERRCCLPFALPSLKEAALSPPRHPFFAAQNLRGSTATRCQHPVKPQRTALRPANHPRLRLSPFRTRTSTAPIPLA